MSQVDPCPCFCHCVVAWQPCVVFIFDGYNFLSFNRDSDADDDDSPQKWEE